MYSSNFRRFTSFFVPTNKTKGQLGERSILSILLMPMLLYFPKALYYTTDISLPFFKYRRRKNVPAFDKAGTS